MVKSNGKRPDDVVIVGAARIPQGKFLGQLQPFSAVQLGTIAVKAAVERSRIDPGAVDEVILGQVIPAGSGQAVPRQVWIGAGYPDKVGGLASNKACGSGMKAVMLASNAIKAGDGSLYVAGGMESMSNAPYLDFSARQGARFGNIELKDSLIHDGLWCSMQNWVMGNAAEFIGNQFEVTREEMDEFALRSQQKAAQATDSGKFKTEIVPITIKGKATHSVAHGDTVIDQDEPIRRDTSLERLASLKPAVAYGQAAVNPQWLFYAPVKAIPVALERAGWSMEDVDLFELNEAFASQVLADLRGLEREGHTLPLDKLNVNGGAIALGHPVGASGARVLITLIYALKDRGLKRGLASLCLGGAEAVATAIEIE